MIRIAQDELKSAANEQLLGTLEQITAEIDGLYERTWLAPLVLVRNAIDDDTLPVDAKMSLLGMAIRDIPDIVALQITVEGSDLPMVAVSDEFAQRLDGAGLDALGVLRVPTESARPGADGSEARVAGVDHLDATDDWLATIVLPLRPLFGDQPATLSARIDLKSVRDLVATHPFTKVGLITITDAQGRLVFDPGRTDVSRLAIVAQATALLAARVPTAGVSPFARPDGEVMLGAFGYPHPFPWSVIVEKREQDAYLAIGQMRDSLVLWGGMGVAIAALGAVLLALGITRPILEVARVAVAVTKGDLQARVRGGQGRDEVGDLARRMNEMIVWLNEHLHLQKFVSGQTMQAIRGSVQDGVALGGERREVTMLFSDIRGYTAFAERVPPETVVESLNLYLQHQADIVAKHKGDIDKFVGDQIVAVFQGPKMERRAVRAALEIQTVLGELIHRHPEWGLAVGIGVHRGMVIMGAMGAAQRMDFTVLGDAVNLSARLCSAAAPGQILVSQGVREAIGGTDEFVLTPLEPLRVKGKSQPVAVYEVAVACAGAPAAA